MIWPVRRQLSWLFTVVVGAACGCSSGQASVSGKVIYKDAPVTYGSVCFLDHEQKTYSGVINPDGSYTVEGMAAGEARVGIISRDPAKGRQRRSSAMTPEIEAQESAARKGWVPLPRHYESALNSGLRCTLTSGHNTRDIKLE
jgi:hypothetical protein